jgi:predicted alpha-1,2-mannosidase
MRRMRGLPVSRWAVVCAITAAVLGFGTSTAVAAPGAPPSPAPSPTSTPGAAPAAGQASTSRAVCTAGSDGRVVNCPKPVSKAKRPAGARNTATVDQAPTDLAQLVDTRTWSSGGGNTFPGADVPFGMTQWSPDTMPNRSAGGGYNFGDTSITGYSLTHISGPGCGAAGDVPMLPMTGALPSGNPNNVTSPFTNTNEVAQAGYYSAQTNQPSTITSEFTATPHSAMARFTYPSTNQAGFLVKLMDSQNGDFGDSAQVVGNNEVIGSDTSGHFCGEVNNDGQRQEYTVYFDITFDHPFTASQVVTNPGQTNPAAVYLSFDTTSNPVIQAKVATSYVSTDNAKLDWQTENPGWDFGAVKTAAQQSWNTLLGRMQVGGGSYAQTQMFYSLLYKDFMQPNISSDVNGQYMGADNKVHAVAAGQKDQYGTYSGWDIYHSLSQLQAMLDPDAAGDQAQSLLNYYAQDKLLQQWGYLQLNNYVMVGDPAQSIIADYYAFGAHNFNTSEALSDMLAQATTVNDVRPGEALEDKYGYLPEDGTYGCCNSHGQVPTLEEYDTQDLALSQFARALGDTKDADMLEARANNWENVFNPANGLLNPRNQDGSLVPGIIGTTTSHYVEGDAYEYMWNVPNNYAALINLLGGKAKAAAALRTYLSQPNGFGMFAQLTNEFDFGEQYAGLYAGDPAGTQLAVNNVRSTMYQPGPSLDNNDDLGANSSTFIWEMLGMYPENSGSDNLVFNSPGFPHASISLPTGKTITINAPGASSTQFYVQNLKINGSPYQKLYVPFSSLADGATLDWTLGTTPSTWGTAPQDAPPSYQAGLRPAVGSLSSQQVTVAPGGTATVTLGAQNATSARQSVQASLSAPAGLSATADQGGRINLPPSGQGQVTVTVHADASTTQTFYNVPIKLSVGDVALPAMTLTVLVAQPGSLLAAFNNPGVTDDNNVSPGNFDGGGRSYSAQALAALGVTPGGTVTAGGIDYTWPVPGSGLPDNATASGQKVVVNAPAGTQQLGFLGAANNGPSQGLTTLTYSDGSTARYWLGLSDWTLNGGGAQPSFGNQVAISTPYRNCRSCAGGRDTVHADIFTTSLPVDPAKTLASVTLPTGATRGALHVFAIGTSTTAMSGAVVASVSPASANAGDVVTVNGSGFGATQGAGYVQFSDNGINWGAPGNTATFTVNSWSDTQITFTVPTPSGATGQFHVWPGTTAMVTVVNDAKQMSDTAALGISPSANVSDYFSNAGISDDSTQSCADYDGGGFTYSAQALSAAGLTPGGTVTSDGLTYTWPNVPSCQKDNLLASGQTLLVNGKAGATKLGLLGSASNGTAQGTITVTYTDGTSSTATVVFTDWAQPASGGNTAVATMPYRNTRGGSSQPITMYVFAEEVPLDSSKTVASVTMPNVSSAIGTTAMHIFALTTS